jgi:hypothetical protein
VLRKKRRGPPEHNTFVAPQGVQHLVGLGQYYPEDILHKMFTRQESPTKLFIKVMSGCDPTGEHLPFLGRTNVYSSIKDAHDLNIDLLIFPFLKRFFPQIIKGRELIYDYKMAGPYALGEYTSLARYARTAPYYVTVLMKLAFFMLSQAFRCMRDALTLTSSDAATFMEPTTSPGYPWSLNYQDKKSLLRSCAYWDYYYRYKNDIMMGKHRPNFWKGFVKREPKKTSKLLLHLPRTVLCAATEHLHQAYEIFKDQNDQIKNAGLKGEIPAWIGATKYYGGWHRLYIRLKRFPNAFDADCDQFDGSVFKAMFCYIRNFRFSGFKYRTLELWYMIKNYYANVCSSATVCSLGDVFLKMMGMPSGQFNTLTDNCFVQCVIWFYHWCRIVVPNVPGTQPTYDSFKKHVELIVQGDDVIYSCSNEVLRWMCPAEADKTFKLLGFLLKYSSNNSRPVEDLEFCSTNFVFVDGMWMPKLRFEKLMASLCYGHMIKTRNVRGTLTRMLSLRIEGYYNFEFRKIVEPLIDWYIQEYESELSQPNSGQVNDPLSFDQIKTLNRSHYEIVTLYRGVQG